MVGSGMKKKKEKLGEDGVKKEIVECLVNLLHRCADTDDEEGGNTVLFAIERLMGPEALIAIHVAVKIKELLEKEDSEKEEEGDG